MFSDPDSHLSQDEEFNRYELHNNDADDPRYRNFLKKLLQPVDKLIPANSTGLDFGSGPTPVMQMMLEEKGHRISIYDAFYASDETVFKKQYDFITASEVVEHLHHPMEELDRLWSCLSPDGVFGIMTALRYETIDIPDWYYMRDPTHVVFFSPLTFQWLAKRWGADLDFVGDSVVIFKKQPVV